MSEFPPKNIDLFPTDIAILRSLISNTAEPPKTVDIPTNATISKKINWAYPHRYTSIYDHTCKNAAPDIQVNQSPHPLGDSHYVHSFPKNHV